GTNAARSVCGSRWNADARARRRPCKPRPIEAPADSTDGGTRSRRASLDHRGRGGPRTRGTLLGTGDDGVAATPTARRGERTGATTRGATRENTGSSPQRATLDARERHRSSPSHTGHAAPTRAYESRHNLDDSRCAPPADPNPANSGANNPCPVDRPHSI